jgi:hypothetical protein
MPFFAGAVFIGPLLISAWLLNKTPPPTADDIASRKFAFFRDWSLSETRNGVYTRLTDGEADLFFSPEPYVYIINGVGGAGMTLSFGLAEELVAGL